MSFSCTPCNKIYKTYQSIWNHNKRFHSDMIIHITEKVRNFSCNKCKKTFTRNDSLKLHINNTCKKKNELDKIEKMQCEILELKEKLKEVNIIKKTSESNNTVSQINNCGIIYFIQPSELVGTNRFKIGCSKNPSLDRCNKGYRKGSRYICIMECTSPELLEHNIKNEFNKQFKLIAGTEYFEGDESIMLQNFIEIINKFKSKNNKDLS